MKKFNYEARDTTTNKVVKSLVQADSETAAAKLLIGQGFTPLKITEEGEGSNPLAKLTGRITTKDKVVFTRQLATLLGAGIPLAQSLHTVAEQTENKHFQDVIEEIIASVEGGKSLSQAFGAHDDVFDHVFLALIAAGETSGTLDDSLRRIADQQEKDAAVASKIRGALTYPVIVLVVIIGVVIFMLLTVVPQVENIYSSMGKTLPILTQVMVAFANFLIHFWWIIIIVAVVGGYFLFQYLKTDAGITAKDKFKLNVPVFKGMFRKLYMARFARTGQTLLQTGVAMLDTLQITGKAVNNTIIQASIDRAAEKVKGGKALSTALQPEPYILPMVPQMIKIGEQSGKIDDMMGKTAKIYEDELDEEIRAISTAIEPILMVVLAVVAGGIVGAVLFPIYSLAGGINV
ncbi:MAG TPA: type II secretion system F family protein [Candidatus Saccharimonadaceae bacterium]|nr:type II secretion system F family protein [Candidatus Saccharimonadaceae bacterium]